LETGHEFGKIDDTMSILYYKKGKHLDIIEKFYIYRETKDSNQPKDKHTVIYNKIFETIIGKGMNVDERGTPHTKHDHKQY
jgi:chromatin remodeling complex protein RSC6